MSQGVPCTLSPDGYATPFTRVATFMQRCLRIVSLALCLLLLASCASASGANSQQMTLVQQPGSDLPSPTPQNLSTLLQTEQVLMMTPPQASNLYTLVQQLKTHQRGTPARPNNSTPLHAQVGQEDSFWLQNQDSNAYTQIRARLAIITPHTYVYVEDDQPFNQAALLASANVFEQQIYTTERANAGSEWTPGIDGDGHITILNVANLGSNNSGYFSAQDEYSSSVNPHSNQREMFYVNLDGASPGSPDYNGVLANEFQQLINWNEHPLTLDWFNQGLALLAQHVNAYPANGVDQAFLKAPDVQLTDWSNDPGEEPLHAGASYLFLDYFIEHYGGYPVLKELLQDPAPPPTNFDNVLENHHFSERFNDVFNKWLVANAVADPSIDKGEYGYPTIHIPGVTPQHTVTGYPFQEADQVEQYGAEYYDLHSASSKTATLSIHLEGAPTVRLVGNDPLDSSAEWWGNRASNMDSTLTHGFDLRSLKGQQATLQFATWFDLQQDHDYAYVEVSSDNGANWTTLKGNFTTASNPAGLNLGNGYTGVSGDGDQPAWVQERIDLTSYAGQKILLRFEEVTDNSLDLQGFAVDQVRIPELHFTDDLSSTNGWISKGFVYTSNILPQHFLVQAIIYTGSSETGDSNVTVQTMNVDLASAQGDLKIANFGSQVTRVVLVVSAYAPDSTLQAHYQLQIRA
ncbi:MAG TPA: hypothetical protein VF458_09350 [Ktedonobacteraceae bacterium]